MPAARDATAATADDFQIAPAEEALGARDERREVGVVAVAHREPHLDRIGSGRGPGDVAGRQPRIDEAVQEPRIDEIGGLDLQLHADEEAARLPEAEPLRHARARAVRADEEPCGDVRAGETEFAVDALRAREAHAAIDLRAGGFGFRSHPAQQVAGARRIKTVARREEIDACQVRRVEAHARHAPRQVKRNVEFVDRLAHQDAGGVHARAGIGHCLDHRDLQAARGGGAGGGKTRKARANNHQVEFSGGRHRRPLASSLTDSILQQARGLRLNFAGRASH